MSSPIIVSLDVDYDKAISLANDFDPEQCRLKVGSQLFTSSGPKVVEDLSSLGFDIFLDLKFHDIPNTVSEAVKAIKELCGKEFIAVTPGIRSKKANDDQSRVSSPKEALDNGSDFLVIGRPVTESSNPLESLNQVLCDIGL